ncbi:hypothetical protein [Thioalkalivibrio sp. ALMg9]|uniref:hypothetical protein n=1 Tax=Thioalkalivibrio sp. ALMg9 TaxID=1266912 RepID=UPI00035DA485|nr:hypothetical protein [Thioalkalivibrio sp. ALMg9]
MTEANLYQRLGSKARIRGLARQHFRRGEHGCICNGTGGPQACRDRDRLTIHRGMNIREGAFVAVVDDLAETLDGLGIGQREKEALPMISGSLKPEIVRV